MAACFCARLFTGQRDVYVYRNSGEAPDTTDPVGVEDSILTGEKWLTPPVEMTLDRVIPGKVVARVCRPMIRRMREGHPWHDPEPLSAVERMQFYRRSLPTLERAGVPILGWEREWCDGVIAIMEARP